MSWRATAWMAAASLIGAGLATGCLDPLTSDAVGRPELILPFGSEVPSVENDSPTGEKILANDGVSGDVIHAHSGFWNGQAIRYWDFGAASPVAIPLYQLVEEDPAGFFEAHGKHWNPIPESHVIFDKVPGDAGYSPWWAVVLVPVTDKYDGQVLTSFDAVGEAMRQELVGYPMSTTKVVNCPVVADEVSLERTPDGPLEGPQIAYYKGKVIYYFSFDEIVGDGPTVGVSSVYQLRREGGEPLSEPLRGVDMTGDGDRVDTNDVFLTGPGEAGYSGMVHIVDVVVKADVMAIDTSGDDTMSDLSSVDALFTQDGGELVPDPAHVIAIYPEGAIVNRPIAPLD